ncbi:MAG: 5'/3'-nucleotidase SurE [Proteobacteria bacterium]|nr:5'/3'-nucleotidase SurE [Pseudomonadota bacterium]
MDKRLKVLLTNDDGIDAPGIMALERAFEAHAEVEVWTVAPNRERSTSSHAMSLSRPIFTYDRGPRRVAVDGLPADCVYLALFGLLDFRPDIIVSGINRGANLGCDVIYSGTVGCAREAAQRGIHGVAASLVKGSDYDPAAKSVCSIAIELARRPVSPVLLLNLNYPGGEFDGPRFARLGIRNYPLTVSKRTVPLDNRPYYWLGGPAIEDQRVPGTDGWLIGRGTASATLLSLDQTDNEKMAEAAALTPFIKPLEEE